MIVEPSKILEACCICLGQNVPSKYPPHKHGGENWIAKLMFCVDKIIWSSDYIICEACAEQLDTVYDFHRLCHSSNEKRQSALKSILVNNEYKDTVDKNKDYTTDKSSVNDDSANHCKHYDTLSFQNQVELKEHYAIVHSNLDTIKKSPGVNNDFTSQIKSRYKRKLHAKYRIKRNKEETTDNKCDTTLTNLSHNTTIDDASNKYEPGDDEFGTDIIPDGHLNLELLPSTETQRNDVKCSTNLLTEKCRLPDEMCNVCDDYAELQSNCNVDIRDSSVTSKCTERSTRRIRNTSKKGVAENCKGVGKKENRLVNSGSFPKSDEEIENMKATNFVSSSDYSGNDSDTDNNSDVDLESLDNSNGVSSVKSNKKNNIIFRCDLCDSTFTFCIKFMEHSVSVHNLNEKDVRPYACTHCPKRFNKHSTLKDHTKSHDPVRNEMCSYCGKAFKTKRALTIHEKQHLNLREYQCPHCPKRFNTHKNRNTHIYILHSDPNTWKHVCNICEKKFALKTTYIAHMRIHSTFKQFACHLCDKRFTDRTTLRNHLTSHSNVREHKCSECGNEYKNIKYLKVHMAKAHSIGNIKLPVRVKKHFCHMCPKAFCYKNKLLRHIYTHTGERPFPCSVCDKRFTDKSYAAQHMKSIHNIVPDVTEESL